MNILYLASASPRRRDILQQLGYAIECCPANIDEMPHQNEAAFDYVLRMAVEKNQAARKLFSGSLKYPLISADTTVALNNHILGKPESTQHAFEILKQLSNCTHQVLTAVCVYFQGQTYSVTQSSDVRFKILNDDEIRAYIATGEPMDKAGAYGIQGIAGAFVQHLAGSFTGVMGLPVYETIELLRQSGAAVPPFQAA
ncbi:Maf family protein [Neisseriaceae bacterium B1]